jgi:hypothetical protein
MSSSGHKKRGGTFHLEDFDTGDDSSHNVQFVTPHYDEPAMPEPLDLSKLCLDDDLFEKDETELTQQDEELQTRGRSRSRSVHENDMAAADLIPSSDITGVTPVDTSSEGGQKGKKDDKGSRKGGPLQQREVQALKKVSTRYARLPVPSICCASLCPRVTSGPGGSEPVAQQEQE